MSQRKVDEEPLLPPWIMSIVKLLGPLAVVIGIWWLLVNKLSLPPQVTAPALAVLALFVVVFLGGRLYKPFRVDKTGKCIARTASDRKGCRHYMPGAKLGGGCGRQREDRHCRYVKG